MKIKSNKVYIHNRFYKYTNVVRAEGVKKKKFISSFSCF